MKRAIFISAGLGDSLLTIPLARRLRATSQTFVAILTSPVMTASFLEKLDLFDHIERLPLRRAKPLPDWAFLSCALRNFRAFDEVYLPPFSLVRYNRVLSLLLGKRRLECLPRSDAPFPMVHDAVQNLRLIDPKETLQPLTSELITFPMSTIQRLVHGRQRPDVRFPYVAVQISTSHGDFPHKSWPLENWESWLRLVVNQFPALDWVLVGGPREQAAIDQMMQKHIPRLYAGSTLSSLEDAAAVLQGAKLFVGLDGGLMHMAACLDTPTFTLWGASNPDLYGYEQMDKDRHRIISLKTLCGPCESWLNPNQTRVKVARKCPDFRCIRELSPTAVFHEFTRFLQTIERQTRE